MDGENHGKPYEQMDDLGGFPPFLETPKSPFFPLPGDLLDVSAGREMYGPGGGYSLLSGHDVTRCLATMSLAPR